MMETVWESVDGIKSLQSLPPVSLPPFCYPIRSLKHTVIYVFPLVKSIVLPVTGKLIAL